MAWSCIMSTTDRYSSVVFVVSFIHRQNKIKKTNIKISYFYICKNKARIIDQYSPGFFFFFYLRLPLTRFWNINNIITFNFFVHIYCRWKQMRWSKQQLWIIQLSVTCRQFFINCQDWLSVKNIDLTHMWWHLFKIWNIKNKSENIVHSLS